jgi:hypothetical protein
VTSALKCEFIGCPLSNRILLFLGERWVAAAMEKPRIIWFRNLSGEKGALIHRCAT